ncbi:MAG: hypothetical protein AB7O66_22610 [Limisphaerales bacterium]
MKTRNGILALLNLVMASASMLMTGCVRYTTTTSTDDSPPVHWSPAMAHPETAWVPAQVTPYTVGRYVDGRDRTVLHEAHTVYRQEVSVHPNRMPPESLLAPGAANPADPASLALVRDALTAELNEQRATSRALIEQAQSLDKVLKHLDDQTQEFREMARKGLQIHGQLQAVSNRLETLESRLRSLQVKPDPIPGADSY